MKVFGGQFSLFEQMNRSQDTSVVIERVSSNSMLLSQFSFLSPLNNFKTKTELLIAVCIFIPCYARTLAFLHEWVYDICETQ